MKRDWKASAKTLSKMDAAHPEFKQTLRYDHRQLKRIIAAQGKMEGGEKFVGRYQSLFDEERLELQLGPDGVLFYTNSFGCVDQLRQADEDTLFLGHFQYLQVITPVRGSNGKISATNNTRFRYAGGKVESENNSFFRSSAGHEAADRYLLSGQYTEAEAAYREALAEYPDHFFLEDALEHLVYRKRLSPEDYAKQLEEVAGQYEERRFWV
jgi:tetratricopeptide (TPR) repeat protein